MLFDTWERSSPTPLLDKAHWPRDLRQIAASDASEAAIAERFGVPFDSRALIEGVGEHKMWLVGFACGCELLVFVPRPDALGYGGVASPGAGVVTNDPDDDHALHHFGLPVTWRAESGDEHSLPVERWSLFRQDDNGNQFPMRDFDSKASAECARRTFEARGHKQLYTIARAALGTAKKLPR